MKRSIQALFTLLLLLAFAGSANCQINYGRTYRVVAYKKADLSVFSISNEVTVIPSMTLYVPNTFTPNGDGLNDTFGINGEAIKEFSMQIYNRWGRLIFESTDANLRWDGTYDGQRALQGSYIYKITATGPAGGSETKEGNVNLIM